MANLNGFHHVALRTDRFDEAVTFYVRALGMKQAFAWGQGDRRAVMLDSGNGNYLEIFSRDPLEPADAPILHLALRTDDVDAMTTEPKDVDIPSTPPLRVRLSFFKGPAGEIVELFQLRDA